MFKVKKRINIKCTKDGIIIKLFKMQEIKDPINHPANDPLHARSDPTPVQLALVLVQMTLGLQGLELVMGETEEQSLVMLPPPEQSLRLAHK